MNRKEKFLKEAIYNINSSRVLGYFDVTIEEFARDVIVELSKNIETKKNLRDEIDRCTEKIINDFLNLGDYERWAKLTKFRGVNFYLNFFPVKVRKWDDMVNAIIEAFIYCVKQVVLAAI